MSDYDGVLQENIWHELMAVREGQQAMASVPGDIAELKTDMREVKARLTNVEFAVTDLSKQHCQLDGRITRLEKSQA